MFYLDFANRKLSAFKKMVSEFRKPQSMDRKAFSLMGQIVTILDL